MSRELIDRIAEKLEQVSDDNEFLYRKSTGEIICRDPEFLDESTLEDIEVNWKDYILLTSMIYTNTVLCTILLWNVPMSR